MIRSRANSLYSSGLGSRWKGRDAGSAGLSNARTVGIAHQIITTLIDVNILACLSKHHVGTHCQHCPSNAQPYHSGVNGINIDSTKMNGQFVTVNGLDILGLNVAGPKAPRSQQKRLLNGNMPTYKSCQMLEKGTGGTPPATAFTPAPNRPVAPPPLPLF